MEFWTVVIGILTNEVTATVAVVALAFSVYAGWRRKMWQYRLIAFAMMAWVGFEVFALAGAGYATNVGFSRFARVLMYLAVIFLSWRNNIGGHHDA